MKYLLALFLGISFLSAAEPVTPPPVGATQPTWASAGGKDKYGTWADLTVAGVTQRFRWIAPGTFTMGSPQSEKDLAIQAMQERTERKFIASEVQHEVTISKGYWLADSECTHAMWKAITGSNFEVWEGPQNPVEVASWDDIQEFLAKLNTQVSGAGFRLPTEAEWEYSCRAGTKTAFSFGETITSDQVNYDDGIYSRGSATKSHGNPGISVKSYPPNGWGLYDMHGNVWEWCSDWYGDYSMGKVTDPIGPLSGSDRVIRGGSWKTPSYCIRSANRRSVWPHYRSCHIGFRFLAQTTP